MLAVLAPLIVFGLVIFIHELGHFIAAKLTGVYAPRFSIGFGPPLLRMRRGETEYVLAALPLGGYVRMASRHDAETAFLEGGNEESGALKPGDAGYDPEAMAPFGPRPVPEHRWFESKGLPARLLIMIAGVTMNILLAFVVYSVVNVVYGEPVIGTRVVAAVRPLPSAPQLADLHAGDTISAVNGHPIRNWSELLERLDAAEPGALTIRTSRGELSLSLGISGAPSASDVARSIDFFIPPVIGELLPGSPAVAGGLHPGDTIVTIGNAPVHGWSDLQQRVSASANVDLPFQVRRSGRLVSMRLHPTPTTERDPVSGAARTVGKIGATPADFSTRERTSVTDGVRAGARQTWFTATRIVDVVRGLFTARISIRQLGGPIAITRASVAAGRSGLESVVLLIAMLSVNVAILNLLPIPILDGGQILINVAEAAKGSPFSMRTREYILRFGLVAILLIFAMSTFNDVVTGFRDIVARLFG